LIVQCAFALVLTVAVALAPVVTGDVSVVNLTVWLAASAGEAMARLPAT
jgi:hypothetical protein